MRNSRNVEKLACDGSLSSLFLPRNYKDPKLEEYDNMEMNLQNKKLLKEWNKIKDFNVFQSFENFAEFYYLNGEKSCFRINTNEPWSEDNFFFGEYSELLAYYREEHPKKYVGKKFYSLTILDMLWQEYKGKDVLHAKCKCDCGNETIKPFEGISKGNTRSCGCLSRRNDLETYSIKETHPQALAFWDYEKNTVLDTSVTSKSTKTVWWKCDECGTGFQQSVSSFLRKKHCPACDEKKRESVWNIYPELVEDEWDYTKNGMDPKELLISSEELVWWKPRYGIPFQATVADRMRSSRGTSFEEQAIFYYVKRFFEDAVNRGKYVFDDSGEIEIDIYIPCLHFAIEYDGVFWHKNKTDRDYRKNNVLKNAGVHLLRVRESGLEDLEDGFGEVIYRKTSLGDEGLHLQEVINEIVECISSYISANRLNVADDVQSSLNSFILTKEALIENRPNIYAQYVTAYQKDNITKTCLMKFWDFEKNGNLLPQNVSVNARVFVVLTCPQGHSFQVRPAQYKLTSNQSSQCKNCILMHCPSVLGYTDCDVRNCDTYKTLIETSTYVPIAESERHHFFVQRHGIQIENSPCTKTLIKSPHMLYKKMKKSIADKLKNAPETISSKTILKWFICLDVFDRFELLKSLDAVAQTSTPSLIDKVKDVLNNKISLQDHFFVTKIDVPNIIPANDALCFFKTYGSKNFSYSSLEYFDDPAVMEDFCDLLLSECEASGSVSSSINQLSLAAKIERDYKSLSEEFLVRLYGLLTRLNQIQTIPEFDRCKELIYPKIATKLLDLEDELTRKVVAQIQMCSIATQDQIRSWIETVSSPKKEDIICLLYTKGLLKYIGDKVTNDKGCRFEAKELKLDFIDDVDTQLSIMEILGIHRFQYSLKSFDDPRFSDRFISLIKKSADTSEEFLVSGYNSDQLKTEIFENIDELSYEFAKKLYEMAIYLSSPINRSYPCWYDDDPKEMIWVLEREIAQKERYLTSQNQTSDLVSNPDVIVVPLQDITSHRKVEVKQNKPSVIAVCSNDDTSHHKIETGEDAEEEKKFYQHKLEIEEDAKDKARRRSQGLCQYCGNTFKRRLFLFGNQICSKCGRTKDY